MTAPPENPHSYNHRELTLIETNIDDMNPEFFPGVMKQLLERGARDCWLTPVIMKHGRPAHCLSALCEAADVEALSTVIFQHTTTLGVRIHPVKRVELAREIVPVCTPHGEIKVKVGRNGSGEVLNASPEFRDCEKRSMESGVPVKEVYREAQMAFERTRKF